MRFLVVKKKAGWSRGGRSPPRGGGWGGAEPPPPCHRVRFQKNLWSLLRGGLKGQKGDLVRFG